MTMIRAIYKAVFSGVVMGLVMLPSTVLAQNAGELRIVAVPDDVADKTIDALVQVVDIDMTGLERVLVESPDAIKTKPKDLQSSLLKKTVAHASYEWTDETGEHKKAYRAMSGDELDKVLPAAGPSGGGNSSTRAIATHPGKPSALSDSQDIDAKGNPVSRHLDAELKLVRTIEFDIANGHAQAGGKMTVRVSQEPCASCRKVLDDFSKLPPEARPARIEVYYLKDNPGKLATAASARFHNRRQPLIKKAVSSGRVTAGNDLRNGKRQVAGCL